MRLLLILLAVPAVASAHNQIAYIEFFGHKGMDVQVVCCTGDGDSVLFIGLPGASSAVYGFSAAPNSVVSPPAGLMAVYETMRSAELDAVRKSQADEDGAPGYRLLKEPAARGAEQALRSYAIAHEEEIVDLLKTSGSAQDRALAADALGFGARSPRQIGELLRATRDPDPGVRNNAVRGLVEILRADPSAAAMMAPDNFIQMLRSTVWTDRNKASAILVQMTQSRNPELLRRLNAEAGDALGEMAAWRPIAWATGPRLILGRIAGESDLSAYFSGLPLSVWQGSAVAAGLSGLLAFVVSGRSRGAWWRGGPLAGIVSGLLYVVLVHLAGLRVAEYGVLGLGLVIAWSVVGWTAWCAVVAVKTAVSLP